MPTLPDAEYAALLGGLDVLYAAVAGVAAAEAALAAAPPPVPPPVPRFFAAESPWNTPDDPAWPVDPRSDALIGSIATALGTKRWYLNGTTDWPNYGLPLFVAPPGTPIVQVACNSGWWKEPFTMPMPVGATPSIGSDHHLLIHEPGTRTLYELWDARKDTAGKWSCGGYGLWRADGQGWKTQGEGARGIGARAYGGSALGGLILAAELAAGRIPHALAWAYQTPRKGAYAAGSAPGGPVCIGGHTDGQGGPDTIPEGARLRLRANVDIDALAGGEPGTTAILTALREYGCFLVDHAGTSCFYVEVGTPAGLARDTDIGMLKPEHLEVLRLPELTPGS